MENKKTTPKIPLPEVLYLNWLKAVHMIFVARQGVENLVVFVAKLLHKRTLVQLSPGHSFGDDNQCAMCKTKNEKKCQEDMFNSVIKTDRFYKPDGKPFLEFESVSFSDWYHNSWTIARCFMQEHCSTHSSHIDTDLIGFLAFMKKCSLFKHFLENKQICTKVSV